MRLAAAMGCVWLLAAATAGAHPAPFSYLDRCLTDTGVDGSIVMHDLDVAHDLGVDPPERFADPAFADQYRDPVATDGIADRAFRRRSPRITHVDRVRDAA